MRGQLVRDEWLRYLRYPESRSTRWSTRWAPFLELTIRWLQEPSSGDAKNGGTGTSRRRKFIGLGRIVAAAWITLTDWKSVWADETQIASDRSRESLGQTTIAQDNRTGGQGPLRVAYLGPTPRQDAGGPVGCAWLILEQLARSGVGLDCYVTATDNKEQLETISGWPRVRVISVGSAWRWNRWYSRSHLMAMVTGLSTTAVGRRRLVSLLVEQHQLNPYDALYQFSTIEVFGRRKDRGRLPPIVLHPEVHAAGELRWLFKERKISRRCEGLVRPKLVMGWFWLRSRRQRRDVQRAVVVLAVSESFGRHLVKDYGIDPTRIRIAPNPIDLDGFRPLPSTDVPARPLEIAIVGRLSVRKGLELIVQLSHRLRDLSGIVHLEIVGNPSQWSNYRVLLDTIDLSLASYKGFLSHHDLQKWLAKCDLLLQPAKYEPFGLTVGEALASGVPVVVTTEVGAGEGVSEACCTRVPPEDLDSLEEAVRGMVARLRSPACTAMRTTARSEAERLWAATSVTRPVIAALFQVAGLAADRSTPLLVGQVDGADLDQRNGARDLNDRQWDE